MQTINKISKPIRDKSADILVETVKVSALTLHPEALTTPVMNEVSYNALKADIELKGQLDPVILFRGKIVDGRHRWLILQELGITMIKVTKLPNNTTLTQIKSLVISKETRRHESAAQLGIRAYRLTQTEGLSQEAAAQKVGAAAKQVSFAKKIDQLHKRPDILELLFRGEKFPAAVPTNQFAMTESMNTIHIWLVKNGSVKPVNPKVKKRTELTEDEQTIVNEFCNAIMAENAMICKEIASTLYSYAKRLEEESTE